MKVPWNGLEPTSRRVGGPFHLKTVHVGSISLKKVSLLGYVFELSWLATPLSTSNMSCRVLLLACHEPVLQWQWIGICCMLSEGTTRKSLSNSHWSSKNPRLLHCCRALESQGTKWLWELAEVVGSRNLMPQLWNPPSFKISNTNLHVSSGPTTWKKKLPTKILCGSLTHPWKDVFPPNLEWQQAIVQHYRPTLHSFRSISWRSNFCWEKKTIRLEGYESPPQSRPVPEKTKHRICIWTTGS